MAEPVLGTLTLEDLGKLRKLSPPDAELFLAAHTLSEQERGYVDKLVGRDLKSLPAGYSVQVHDPTRRLWLCAAWLAGASWRQLARLHQVAPQTIMSVADRELTSFERQVLRNKIQPKPISLESLDAYRNAFVKNVDTLKHLPAQEVAQWLLDNTELDNE